MTCCTRSAPCERMFTPKDARRRLARYRKKGLDAIERTMMATVPPASVVNARVLEIGGGIGTIQAEFLRAGAKDGEIIELLPAYEPFAKELAREAGIEDRSTFRIADVLDNPASASPADIVVLDRVVCCSPDGVALMGVAARLATRMLLVVHPRDRWFMRVAGRVANSVFRLLGRSFRVFIHPGEALYAAATREGLAISETGNDIAWQFVTFRRQVQESSSLKPVH